MFSLQNTTALITGASRGIGFATAQALHGLGAQVILHGTTEATAAAAAKKLPGAKFVAANLLEPGAAEALAEAALTLADHQLNILVNNAGITRDALFARQKQEQWDDVLTVNLDAVVRLTRALLPAMQKTKQPANFGRIVNVTSVVAHMGNLGQTNYITAKAALTGFTKALSREVARKGITVNAVAPGFIETDMTAPLTADLKENFVKNIPLQRFGTSEEVAACIAFLCTPAAGYLTGTTLHPNGGLYLP